MSTIPPLNFRTSDEELPNEILIKIFSFLPTSNLLPIFGVSKLFNQLALVAHYNLHGIQSPFNELIIPSEFLKGLVRGIRLALVIPQIDKVTARCAFSLASPQILRRDLEELRDFFLQVKPRIREVEVDLSYNILFKSVGVIGRRILIRGVRRDLLLFISSPSEPIIRVDSSGIRMTEAQPLSNQHEEAKKTPAILEKDETHARPYPLHAVQAIRVTSISGPPYGRWTLITLDFSQIEQLSLGPPMTSALSPTQWAAVLPLLHLPALKRVTVVSTTVPLQDVLSFFARNRTAVTLVYEPSTMSLPLPSFSAISVPNLVQLIASDEFIGYVRNASRYFPNLCEDRMTRFEWMKNWLVWSRSYIFIHSLSPSFGCRGDAWLVHRADEDTYIFTTHCDRPSSFILSASSPYIPWDSFFNLWFYNHSRMEISVPITSYDISIHLCSYPSSQNSSPLSTGSRIWLSQYTIIPSISSKILEGPRSLVSNLKETSASPPSLSGVFIPNLTQQQSVLVFLVP